MTDEEDIKVEEDFDPDALDDDDVDLKEASLEDEEDPDGDEAEGEDNGQPPEGEAALDKLAEEELELLDEEEATDLPVNEAAELRAIHREELTMDVEAQAIRGDEFVCSVCFLVKRSNQLANKRKVVCRDCAA